MKIAEGYLTNTGRVADVHLPPLPLMDSTILSPLCTILRYPYLVTDPKKFLKEPLAPIYTYFEGGARKKKRHFFGQSFPKKCFKTPFLALLAKFCLRRKKITKTGFFSALGELGKSIRSTLKKGWQSFWNFLKIRPFLLEKVLDPPL